MNRRKDYFFISICSFTNQSLLYFKVSGFVAALRIFLRYGLVNNLYATNQPTVQDISMRKKSHFAASSKSGNGPYRPPHLRKKAMKNMQHEEDGSPILPEDSFSKIYFTSSDSDCSDSDGSVKDNCIVLFAKARLGAIVCIQVCSIHILHPDSFYAQFCCNCNLALLSCFIIPQLFLCFLA